MLNIPLLKLTSRTEQEMFANHAGFGMDERHHVLQLVAEAEGAP
jgi:hypothetical protein